MSSNATVYELAKLAATLTALYFSIVLFSSGLIKVYHRDGFQNTLFAQKILPRRLVPAISFLVPLYELVLSFAVVLQPQVFMSIIVATFLTFAIFKVIVLKNPEQ